MRVSDYKTNHKHPLIALVLLAATASAWGLPWDQDMVDQPSAKPQESATPAEPDAVPIEGGETLPAPTTEREIFAAKDAAATIPNPVPATAESIERGAAFYEINCRVCHGDAGRSIVGGRRKAARYAMRAWAKPVGSLRRCRLGSNRWVGFRPREARTFRRGSFRTGTHDRIGACASRWRRLLARHR